MWKKIIFIFFLLFPLLINQQVVAVDPLCTRQTIIDKMYRPFTQSGPHGSFSGKDGSDPYLYFNHGVNHNDFSGLDQGGYGNKKKPDYSQHWASFNEWWNQLTTIATAEKCSLDPAWQPTFKELYENSDAHDYKVQDGVNECTNSNSDGDIQGCKRTSRPDGGCMSNACNRDQNARYKVYLADDLTEVERLVRPLPGDIQACTTTTIDTGFNDIKPQIQADLSNTTITVDQALLHMAQVFKSSMDGAISPHGYGCNLSNAEIKPCLSALAELYLGKTLPESFSLSSIPACQFTSVSSDKEGTLCTQATIKQIWTDVKTEVDTHRSSYVVTAGANVGADTGKLQEFTRNLIATNYNSCIIGPSCYDIIGSALEQSSSSTYPVYGGNYTCKDFTHEINFNDYNQEDCGRSSYVSVGEDSKDTSSKCCVDFNANVSDQNNFFQDQAFCANNDDPSCTSRLLEGTSGIASRIYGNAIATSGNLIGFCRNEIDDITARRGIVLEPYNEAKENNQCRCKAESFSQSAKLYCNRYIASSIISKAKCSLKVDNILFGGEANRLENLDVDQTATDESSGIASHTSNYQYRGEEISGDAAEKIKNIVVAERCTNKAALSVQLPVPSGSKEDDLTVDDIKAQPEYIACLNCVSIDGGIPTALGCIRTRNFQTFIQSTVLGWGIGLAGIFALMCIIYSAIQLQLSQGNPERIKKTQEMLTSCITGLILVIFSVFILRFIGVDILKIPGLGK